VPSGWETVVSRVITGPVTMSQVTQPFQVQSVSQLPSALLSAPSSHCSPSSTTPSPQ